MPASEPPSSRPSPDIDPDPTEVQAIDAGGPRVLITTLGLGALRKQPGYDETRFSDVLDHRTGQPLVTRFVQRAVVERELPAGLDRVVVLMTPDARDKHWELLRTEFADAGLSEESIVQDPSLAASQSVEDQWLWFERLLEHVPDRGRVLLDLTHGFRSVPIILSTALAFVRRVRDFDLEHVYYSFVDMQAEETPKPSALVDLVDFYRIQSWTDGVTRLVESADPGLLSALAADSPPESFAALGDRDLIGALERLSAGIRNLDVNAIADLGRDAMREVARVRERAGGPTRLLLDRVLEKFAHLAGPESVRGFGAEYFETQWRLVDLFFDHGLQKEAFIAMGETISSFGILVHERRASSPNARRTRRARRPLASVFSRVVDLPRRDEKGALKWGWERDDEFGDDESRAAFAQLRPLLDAAESTGLLGRLQPIAAQVKDFRNGFAHGWTAKGNARPNAEVAGRECLRALRELEPQLRALAENLDAKE